MQTGRLYAFLPVALSITGALFLSTPSAATDPVLEVAIVIDDLGYRRSEGERAIALPGPVNYGILPHTPHARRLALEATARAHEVILHMPMEPFGSSNPGPGALHISMTPVTIERKLQKALSTLPAVKGLSNHMGSRATSHVSFMNSLMETLARIAPPEFFYLDSRTTGATSSARAARKHGVPHLSRDVFLDHTREKHLIRGQLEELLSLATRRGYAIGIGHPYPETLEVLEDQLPRLWSRGIKLVALSDLAARLAQSPWTSIKRSAKTTASQHQSKANAEQNQANGSDLAIGLRKPDRRQPHNSAQ